MGHGEGGREHKGLSASQLLLIAVSRHTEVSLGGERVQQVCHLYKSTAFRSPMSLPACSRPYKPGVFTSVFTHVCHFYRYFLFTSLPSLCSLQVCHLSFLYKFAIITSMHCLQMCYVYKSVTFLSMPRLH